MLFRWCNLTGHTAIIWSKQLTFLAFGNWDYYVTTSIRNSLLLLGLHFTELYGIDEEPTALNQ